MGGKIIVNWSKRAIRTSFILRYCSPFSWRY